LGREQASDLDGLLELRQPVLPLPNETIAEPDAVRRQ